MRLVTLEMNSSSASITSAPRWIFVLLLVFGLTLSASANTYSGTMTCTVTETNDPLMAIGAVFQNSFQYESNTIDGTFYSTITPGIHDHADLTGEILAAHPGQGYLAPGGHGDNSYIDWTIDGSWFNDNSHNHMTVTGGVVADYLWDNQSGGSSTYYIGDNFSFYTPNGYYIAPPWGDPSQPATFIVKGTIEFSPLCCSVPDRSSTVILLGIAMLILAAFSSWHRAKIR